MKDFLNDLYNHGSFKSKCCTVSLKQNNSMPSEHQIQHQLTTTDTLSTLTLTVSLVKPPVTPVLTTLEKPPMAAPTSPGVGGTSSTLAQDRNVPRRGPAPSMPAVATNNLCHIINTNIQFIVYSTWLVTKLFVSVDEILLKRYSFYQFYLTNLLIILNLWNNINQHMIHSLK